VASQIGEKPRSVAQRIPQHNLESMSQRALRPLPLPPDPSVLREVPRLEAALNGTGPALLPHAVDTPPPAHLGPDAPLAPEEDDPDDPTVAVLCTSGSTGTAKGILLPASALLASASATHDRLGGPGRWLLALPAHHVAGWQVLVRSLVADRTPVVLDLSGGFHPEAFAEAARALRGPRRYTSLVPTQLVRILNAGRDVLRALTGLDAVLVGGAGLPADLRERAEAAGVPLVATYGMTETCGGCVYDGRPLDGVDIRLEPTADAEPGRVFLAGPVLARGHRAFHHDGLPVPTGTAIPPRAFGDGAHALLPSPGELPSSGLITTSPSPDGLFAIDPFLTGPDGRRWLRTDDLGLWRAERLHLVGRIDDLIVTGGLKVAPALVEAALLELPGIREVVVVGVDDPHWGQRVVACLVPAAGSRTPSEAEVRAQVRDRVAAHAAPRQVLRLEAIPLCGPGKPDRRALAAQARAALARAAGTAGGTADSP